MGSNPGGREWISIFGIVACWVELSVSGRSLVERSPTESGVPECDREASTMRKAWPLTEAVAPRIKYVKGLN